ncbi:MAG: outer membrane beta-barrel protein [Myxococcales bacterium]|nr:outer membrane beta-barrel protein [Myxococcales bacterium]
MKWIAGVILALCAPASAFAQSFETTPGAGFNSLNHAGRPAGENSRGVTLGDFVLHPGLAVGGGYNTNVFYEDSTEGTEPAGALQVVPSLRLVTPDPRMFRLKSNLQIRWERLFSDLEEVTSQSGVDVLADLGVQIAPRGIISFTIYDIFRRYLDSPSAPSDQGQNSIYNEIGGIFGFHPGGADRTSRRGFSGTIGVGYGIQRYDEQLELDRSLFMSRLQAFYHFLPKTAIRLSLSYQSISYDTTVRTTDVEGDDALSQALAEAFDGVLVNTDSTPFRATLGIGGLLTRWLDFGLDAGYTMAGYSSGEDFSSWVANASLGFFLTPDARVGIEWSRGFSDSSFANYYTYNRFAADARYLAGAWTFNLSGSFEQREFATVTVPVLETGAGGEVPLYSTADRVDPVIGGRFFIGYNINDMLRVSGSYQLSANLTDFVVTTGRSSGPDRPNSSASQYVRHEFFISTEFEY